MLPLKSTLLTPGELLLLKYTGSPFFQVASAHPVARAKLRFGASAGASSRRSNRAIST